MTTPSIKGSVLSAVVDDVRRLRDEDRVCALALETMLEPADLALLDEKVQPALWYDIECYRRLSEVLLKVEGGGDPAYIAHRGERAAERLFDAGLYVQLSHGEEKAKSAREHGEAFSERDGRLMISLSGAMFNFTRWEYHRDPEGNRIDVRDAEGWPEVARFAVEGFVAYTVSRLRGRPTQVRSERVGPGLARFRFESE